jgi:6-phosphogluconolactonase
MARDALLEPLAISRDHVHRIAGERTDLDAVARDYEADIALALGAPRDGPPPAFDVVLLGMGADGHTASLFPGSRAIDEVERWVVMEHGPSPGPERVTMTPTILNAARHVLFLVAGSEKAEALARVLEGPEEPRRLPAQSIQPVSGTLAWFVDQTAAARLTPEEARHLVQRTDT